MIKATEVGKTFRYATGYDMSNSTELSLTFTHSNGTTFTTTSVTAPDSPVTDPDLGSLNANEYMEYTTTGTDFTLSGAWTVEGVYKDATPKTFYGTDASFIVG